MVGNVMKKVMANANGISIKEYYIQYDHEFAPFGEDEQCKLPFGPLLSSVSNPSV